MKPIEEFKKLKDRLEQKHHIWEAENIIVGDFTYGIPTIC